MRLYRCSPRHLFWFLGVVVCVVWIDCLWFPRLKREVRREPISTIPNQSAPGHVFVFTVDTRPPTNITNYWTQAAALGAYYCEKNECDFLYYTAKCDGNNRQRPCRGYKDIEVPSPWIKIKGILAMLDRMPYGDLAMYMDSDWRLNPNVSIEHFIEHDLHSLPDDVYGSKGVFSLSDKVLAVCWENFNVHTSSPWERTANGSYKYPINSGLILFYKTSLVELFMQKWWESVQVPSALDLRGGHNMAFQWPWEQDRISWMLSTGLFLDDVIYFKDSIQEHPSIGKHTSWGGLKGDMKARLFLKALHGDGGWKLICKDHGQCTHDSPDSTVYAFIRRWAHKVQTVDI